MNLQIGSIYCHQVGDLVETFQILDRSETGIFIKSFWPVSFIPTLELISDLDVRTACTFVVDLQMENLFEIGAVPLLASDASELEQFKRIATAKQERSSHFESGLQEARALLDQHKFEEAIYLLTTLAPYNKLNLTTYELRGKAYMGMENWNDARYDFEYILSQDETRSDITELLNKIP